MKFVLILIGTIITLQVQGQNQPQFMNLQPQYIANDSIRLIVNFPNNNSDLILLVSHSYGLDILLPEAIEGSKLVYALPKTITKKSGKIDLELKAVNQTLLHKTTLILPDTSSVSSLEAFCGPKHILTAKNDFSMAVTSVLDVYDNPYIDGTPIDFYSLIEHQQSLNTKPIKHLMAYHRIYAPDKNGYGTVSVAHHDLGHQDFRLDFYANDPDNYSISYEQQHNYADGQQLIEFKTSVITDDNDNLMGNGTMVSFYIQDTQGKQSMVTAQSVDGIARFSIPAPSYATTWTVRSEIPYYAKSNPIYLSFKSSIKEAPLVLLGNHTIQVGPVKAFMNQFAKDGTSVYLKLYNQLDTLTFHHTLDKGLTTFPLEQKNIPKGVYSVETKIADFEETTLNFIRYE